MRRRFVRPAPRGRRDRGRSRAHGSTPAPLRQVRPALPARELQSWLRDDRRPGLRWTRRPPPVAVADLTRPHPPPDARGRGSVRSRRQGFDGCGSRRRAAGHGTARGVVRTVDDHPSARDSCTLTTAGAVGPARWDARSDSRMEASGLLDAGLGTPWRTAAKPWTALVARKSGRRCRPSSMTRRSYRYVSSDHWRKLILGFADPDLTDLNGSPGEVDPHPAHSPPSSTRTPAESLRESDERIRWRPAGSSSRLLRLDQEDHPAGRPAHTWPAMPAVLMSR